MNASNIIFWVLAITITFCSIIGISAMWQYTLAYFDWQMLPPPLASTPYSYGIPFSVLGGILIVGLLFFEVGQYLGERKQ